MELRIDRVHVFLVDFILTFEHVFGHEMCFKKCFVILDLFSDFITVDSDAISSVFTCVFCSVVLMFISFRLILADRIFTSL
jgi:hypothetical protein